MLPRRIETAPIVAHQVPGAGDHADVAPVVDDRGDGGGAGTGVRGELLPERGEARGAGPDGAVDRGEHLRDVPEGGLAAVGAQGLPGHVEPGPTLRRELGQPAPHRRQQQAPGPLGGAVVGQIGQRAGVERVLDRGGRAVPGGEELDRRERPLLQPAGAGPGEQNQHLAVPGLGAVQLRDHGGDGVLERTGGGLRGVDADRLERLPADGPADQVAVRAAGDDLAAGGAERLPALERLRAS